MTALPTLANRLAPLQILQAGELLIHEIYKSVQGESTFAGLPCVFVRTAVCDLRCRWCDTPHAFNQGESMTRAEVLRRALAFDCPLVEITGGEPLIQEQSLPLMAELCDAGKTVLLETSGARDVGPVDPRVHIIMDLKCPDSGECERNYWPNLDRLKPTDQIKFVIASRRDWDWTVETINTLKLDKPIYLSRVNVVRRGDGGRTGGVAARIRTECADAASDAQVYLGPGCRGV